MPYERGSASPMGPAGRWTPRAWWRPGLLERPTSDESADGRQQELPKRFAKLVEGRGPFELCALHERRPLIAGVLHCGEGRGERNRIGIEGRPTVRNGLLDRRRKLGTDEIELAGQQPDIEEVLMRLLSEPRYTMAWNFSATTDSLGYIRSRGAGRSSSVG